MAAPADLRRTPLYPCHRAAGGRLVPFAGWELPVLYSGVIDEHRAVRSRAGLFDVSHMGEVSISGADAADVLQRLTPNNVAKLVPGRAHYSALLNERGTYLDDILVYRLADDAFLAVVNAANAAQDVAWIRAHSSGRVTVTDVSDDYALLALQGPKAESILAPLSDARLDAIRYYGFAQGAVAGRPAIISRTGYTGEDGFELYLAPDHAVAVWDALLEAGGEDLVPAGLGARDTLRLEAGMALYGHEIDASRTPYEAGLGWVVKLKKGDFVGRDALLAQKAEGPAVQLIGLEITGRGIAREGCAVHHHGRAVGTVASGTFSPTLEKAIATAYVPSALAAPGTALEIAVRKRQLDAVVVSLPFYRRR